MKFASNHGGALIGSLALVAALSVNRARAQDPADAPAKPTSPSEQSWYERAPRAEKQTLARQKAVQRGEERMARLQAMRWYGYSNSRPLATGLPFTTMYSPAWQMPGGRPFGWYTSSRPIVIITGSPVYR